MDEPGEHVKAKKPGVIEWEHMDKTKYYTYGPLSSLATRFMLYPANLIKTRLQIQRNVPPSTASATATSPPAPQVPSTAANSSTSSTSSTTAGKGAQRLPLALASTGAAVPGAASISTHAPRNPVVYKGTIDAFIKIVRSEGVPSLYRGFMPNSLNVIASQLYITTYEVLRTVTAKYTRHEVTVNLVAGLFSSVVSQTLVVPLDLVSQRLMVQVKVDGVKRHTAVSLCSSIFKQEGLRGFFKGYWASVWTYAPSSAVWWAAYGFIRRIQLDGKEHEEVTPVTIVKQAGAGGVAGLVSAVITNPLDVVRARIQVEGRVGDRLTLFSALRDLWRNEGAGGMMNGVTARMIHNGLSGVLLISTYELVKRLSLRDEHIQ